MPELTSKAKYNFAKRLSALNNKSHRADKFSVKVLNIPENISNLLGRQVKSFMRPNINFMQTETNFRGNVYKDKGKVALPSTTITLYDDENAVTSALVYMQVFRQINQYRDRMGRKEGTDDLHREYKFDIEVTFYTSRDEEAEAILLTGCFIQSVEHTPSEMTDSSDTEIILTIEYDNMAIKVFDEFIEVI